ncbi:MAG TPA: alanine dehydrogenase [Bacteroidales bacterium]|nr:alanine dehydrogenase [Bacteroidales bacterium]
MNQEKKQFVSFPASGGMLPKEEMLEVSRKKSSLIIGIPRDHSRLENRIPLVPNAVGLLVKQGHRVLIETEAGKSAWFSDHDYAEYGAEMVETPTEVFEADIILKVAPLTEVETGLMHNRQTLISSLHLSASNEEYIRKLISKKCTALAFEYLRDKTGAYPVRRAMSEIAGNAAILIAAEYLCHPTLGKGHMFGGFSGVSPTEVVILGAGTVGESAAASALGMGAMIKVFDNSIYKMHRLQTRLNSRIYTSVIQPEVLIKSLRTADVVIAALHSSSGRTAFCITEEMVSQMKPGAIIIDVSIDQGGCVETSESTDHQNPVFKKYEVLHYCVPNIASRVPHTASYALSNYLTPILISIGEQGGMANVLKEDSGTRRGTYLFSGIVTNKLLSEKFNLPYQDLNLLMAAF